MKYFRALVLLALMTPSTVSFAAEEIIHVQEGMNSLKVKVSAPIPEDNSNETQARALAREAAVVKGQGALLSFVLEKKAHSKRTLAEAETTLVPLQQHIRGYIKGAQVTNTIWEQSQCIVTLVLNKSELKEILRRN